MSIFALHTLKIQNVLFVASWDEFVTKIQEHESIEKLVLFTHSIAEGLGFAGTYKKLELVVGLFKGHANPRIAEINFEGCNLAVFSEEKDVTGLADFVELFGLNFT